MCVCVLFKKTYKQPASSTFLQLWVFTVQSGPRLLWCLAGALAKSGEGIDSPLHCNLLPLWRAAVAFEVNFSGQMSINGYHAILAADWQQQIPLSEGILLAESVQDEGLSCPTSHFSLKIHTSGDEAEGKTEWLCVNPLPTYGSWEGASAPHCCPFDLEHRWRKKWKSGGKACWVGLNHSRETRSPTSAQVLCVTLCSSTIPSHPECLYILCKNRSLLSL